jgi:hypothetical protein
MSSDAGSCCTKRADVGGRDSVGGTRLLSVSFRAGIATRAQPWYCGAVEDLRVQDSKQLLMHCVLSALEFRH